MHIESRGILETIVKKRGKKLNSIQFSFSNTQLCFSLNFEYDDTTLTLMTNHLSSVESGGQGTRQQSHIWTSCEVWNRVEKGERVDWHSKWMCCHHDLVQWAKNESFVKSQKKRKRKRFCTASPAEFNWFSSSHMLKITAANSVLYFILHFRWTWSMLNDYNHQTARDNLKSSR